MRDHKLERLFDVFFAGVISEPNSDNHDSD